VERPIQAVRAAPLSAVNGWNPPRAQNLSAWTFARLTPTWTASAPRSRASWSHACKSVAPRPCCCSRGSRLRCRCAGYSRAMFVGVGSGW